MTRAVSIAARTLMAVAMFAMFADGSFFARAPVTVAVQCAGAGLLLWSRIVFEIGRVHPANITPRFVRHLIDASVCVFAWAGIAGHWSGANVQLGVLVLIAALVRMCSAPPSRTGSLIGH